MQLTAAASLQLKSFRRKIAVVDISPLGQTRVGTAEAEDSKKGALP